MTDAHTVSVRLGPAEQQAEVLGDVARGFGVGLDVGPASSMGSMVGDVVLPDGAPRWTVEAAFLRILRPRHVLFLCVANSARSQLAEGLARAVAPADVRISSAGSAPTAVRPQAIAVMDEIGIDITGHRSIGIDDVERPVDAVVTLCAEEVCPVWLEDAWRVHWGLPDPAGAGSSPEAELDAFRSVRDELTKRFEVLFG